MADYTPLYIDGKRDSRKRFVSSSGDIISYRQYIKKTEGVSPEQKALQRYQAGLTKESKTAKKILERKKRTIEKQKKKRPPETPSLPTGREDLPEVELSKDRQYYQLSGRYLFVNRKWRLRARSIGYSYATKNKKRGADLDVLREQAINNAKAKLPHSGWEIVGIDYEHWLKW